MPFWEGFLPTLTLNHSLRRLVISLPLCFQRTGSPRHRPTSSGQRSFPDLSLIEATGPIQGSKLERYMELRYQVIDLIAELAEEWHKSDTAKLFIASQATGRLAPPVFRNAKKASGYFFYFCHFKKFS